jgi:tellurite resistance protein TerC
MSAVALKIKTWLDGLAENGAGKSNNQPAPVRLARRIFISLVGGTVLLVGLAMAILPGPAFIVIPLGIAILASEFVWARRILKWIMRRIEGVRRWWHTRKSKHHK